MKLSCATAVLLASFLSSAAAGPSRPRHLAAGTLAPTPSPTDRVIIVEADLNFDATLTGNDQLIGVHIHTGSSTVNGPVNLILCGSAPLPTQNGPCDEISQMSTQNGRFKARFVAGPALGAWDLGINNATAVPGAKTLADGAATTPQTFWEALMGATQQESFVYVNFHTNYSLAHNGGQPFGLARAQLRPVQCPPGTNTALCLGTIGQISSDQTNLVEGLPQRFPPKAGLGKPIRTAQLPNNNAVVYAA